MTHANRVAMLARADRGATAPPVFQPTPGLTETAGAIAATADAADSLSGALLVQTWRRDEQGRLRAEWLRVRLAALDADVAASKARRQPSSRSLWLVSARSDVGSKP